MKTVQFAQEKSYPQSHHSIRFDVKNWDRHSMKTDWLGNSWMWWQYCTSTNVKNVIVFWWFPVKLQEQRCKCVNFRMNSPQLFIFNVGSKFAGLSENVDL
jgi:hypothetical protein